MISPNLVTLILGLTTVGTILWLVRRDKLQATQAFGWVSVALGIATVSIFPATIDYFGKLTGIAYPPTLFLALSVAALTVKALVSDIQLANVRTRHIRLVQRMAMLEEKLSRLSR
jgi:hypothetical protein